MTIQHGLLLVASKVLNAFAHLLTNNAYAKGPNPQNPIVFTCYFDDANNNPPFPHHVLTGVAKPHDLSMG